MPFGLDRYVSLVDSPRGTDSLREPIPALLELWDVPRDPTKDRRMGDFDPALRHHLHQVAIRQSIGDIPTHAELNHVSVERPLAVDWVTGDRLRHSDRKSVV